MKNTRCCPKCGSGDLVIVDGHSYPPYTRNIIMVGSTALSAVSVYRYICCSCGFTEEWIHQDDLERVKKSPKSHSINK